MLQFVERNLDWLAAHIRAKERQRVNEGSAVLQVCQWHKVFWMQLSCRAQMTVTGDGHMKNASDAVERHAINHLRARRVDDRYLRLRRSTLRTWIRIDVRDVKASAIRRRGDVTGTASGQQSLHLRAGSSIQHGHITGDAVGNIQIFPFVILNHARWFRTYLPGGNDIKDLRIDHRHGVIPGVGDKKPVAIC